MGCTSAKQVSAVPSDEDGRGGGGGGGGKAYSNGDLFTDCKTVNSDPEPSCPVPFNNGHRAAFQTGFQRLTVMEGVHVGMVLRMHDWSRLGEQSGFEWLFNGAAARRKRLFIVPPVCLHRRA
ncbi:unnamed protein product [Arctogadus glacialis]